MRVERNLSAAFLQLAELASRPDAFEEILRIVGEITEAAKLPNGALRSGMLVYRARINDVGKSFGRREEVSYIKDAALITRYGRANRPGKSLFYCSDDAITALLETIHSRLNDNAKDTGSVTVGSWRVIRPLENVALILNSVDVGARLLPLSAGAAIAAQVLTSKEAEPWRTALDYLVARFTERVKHHLQYQITSAIFETLVGYSNPGGIAYPSVLSEMLGINYALTPVACDTGLKLVEVVRFDFEKDGDSVKIRETASSHFSRNGSFSFRA